MDVAIANEQTYSNAQLRLLSCFLFDHLLTAIEKFCLSKQYHLALHNTNSYITNFVDVEAWAQFITHYLPDIAVNV